MIQMNQEAILSDLWDVIYLILRGLKLLYHE